MFSDLGSAFQVVFNELQLLESIVEHILLYPAENHAVER